MEPTKICIVDDHKIIRQGLKGLLEKISNYEVVQEFESGEDFINALPLENEIDVFILDYSMPNMNGIEVLQALSQREENYKVLLLTQHFEEQIIDEAYANGARGFLHKNCTANDLKFAIDNIKNIGYNNITEILKRTRNFDTSKSKNTNNPITISARELEFLKLVCDERELTYEQMAEMMGLSLRSVELYRLSLFEKFEIKSKVGLVLFSYKHKLTEPFI
jgi:DNA-binding NarL/FixJ family response regulator